MKADAVSFLDEVIWKSVGAQYVIPVYQRNYAWKRNEQVKRLIEDIENLIANDSKTHFIGTIVYVVTRHDINIQERSVVDGQQRLTTIFLSLYALKSIAEENGDDKIAKSIINQYLENMHSQSCYKLRLKPTVSDDDVFEKIASGNESDIILSKSTVFKNYEYIKKEFKRIIGCCGYDVIINAMRRLYVVYIIIDKSDNPQQIFESINSTGLALTSADLIRNFILMNKDNTTQESLYNNYWRKVENIFDGTKKLEGFFRFYLGAKQYSLTSLRKIYSAFQEYWNSECAYRTEDDVLQDILNYALHYKRLYFSSSDDVFGEDIFDFRKMASDMPAPLVMGVLELNRKGAISDEQAKLSLKAVNTFLIRRYITGRDTSDIVNIFAPILGRIISHINDDYSIFVELLKYYLFEETSQKSSSMPSDDQVRLYLSTANAYSLSHTRWILEKIEKYNNSVEILTNNLSIEHILPQTRSESWSGMNEISDEMYKDVVNRIGNLTLVSKNDNSKMGNRDFNKKKEILSETRHIKLNEYMLRKESWGVEEIESRTSLLIDKILEIFPYKKINYAFTESLSQIYIKLNGEVVARGCISNDSSIEILEESEVFMLVEPNDEATQYIREAFLEKEFIIEKGGRFLLSQRKKFQSLNSAAAFILGDVDYASLYWQNSSGEFIK